MQQTLNPGEVCRDAEVAHKEKKRLDELRSQSQSDQIYAESLAEGREKAYLNTRRSRENELEQTTVSNGDNENKNLVSSLFGLSIQACAENKINVAAALKNGKVKLPSIPQTSDSKSDDKEDRKPAALSENAIHSLCKLPFINQCDTCYEENVKGYSLACSHSQCVKCMRKLFQHALGDNSLLPLRCCDVPIDMNISTQLLEKKDAERLQRRVEEQEATNKMYCPQCSAFLNLDLINSTSSTDINCVCGTDICVVCKTVAHPGVTCAENKSSQIDPDELALELSLKEGWKQCPQCQMIIELDFGCNHMTCINCRHEFCYKCLQPWSKNNNACSSGKCALWDENRLLEAGEL